MLNATAGLAEQADTFVANGARVRVRGPATGAGSPILFLHGVGSGKSVWNPQLDHFGATRRAIAFDYPGYGTSEFAEGATRDDFAAARASGSMNCGWPPLAPPWPPGNWTLWVAS